VLIVDRLLNIKQLAQHYNVTAQTIRNWIKIGLPRIKIGNVLRFKLEDVDEWIKQKGT